MNEDSNNDLLSDMASEDRGYHLTNNQLLKLIDSMGQQGTPIVRQSPISQLDPDATTEFDIVNKINEIITKLTEAGVIE